MVMTASHSINRSPVEDKAFFSTVLDALSALEALCDNVLYKLKST